MFLKMQILQAQGVRRVLTVDGRRGNKTSSGGGADPLNGVQRERGGKYERRRGVLSSGNRIIMATGQNQQRY